MHYTLDRGRPSTVDSYLSNHCRKKPNSGRCRREGLALQAVTNFFNSDTFCGSIVLGYFQFRRSELEGKHKSHKTISALTQSRCRHSRPSCKRQCVPSACAALKPHANVRGLNKNAPRSSPLYLIRMHSSARSGRGMPLNHKVLMC